MKPDWEILVNRLDYHARAWYENDGDIWLKIDNRRAMKIIHDLGYDPSKVMKQFAYRDSESHARYRDSEREQQLSFM